MAKLKTGRHTSAIKAHRQSVSRMLRNRAVKKVAREQAKSLVAAASGAQKDKLQTLLADASSAWDKAAKSGAIHWKTAARKKSRLAAAANKALAKA